MEGQGSEQHFTSTFTWHSRTLLQFCRVLGSRYIIPETGGHQHFGGENSLPLYWSGAGLSKWCVRMDPYFVGGHETTQKILRIAFK